LDTLTLTKPHIEELEDYTELDGLIEAKFLPSPDVSRCFVYRGETGKVEGYVFVQPIVAIEPIWVAEQHRKHGVAPRLFGEAVDSLRRDGTARGFYCRAERPEIESYLLRVGMKAAGSAFVMELRED
jgi:GNAT superfamily N-acetyltransferase